MKIIEYLGMEQYFSAFEDTVELDAALAAESVQNQSEGHKQQCSCDGIKGREEVEDEEEEDEDVGSLRMVLAERPERASRAELFELLSSTMELYRIAFEVGQAAGFSAVFHYGATSREHGAVMRMLLPSVYASTLPDLYLCGGASMFRGVHNAVSCFHVCRGAWTAMPSMPTERRLSAAAVVGHRLHVIGGEKEEPVAGQYRQLRTAECFDAFTGQWQSLEDMPTARAGCAGAAVGATVYVCGGRTDDVVGAVVERFDAGAGAGGWERLPELNTARSGCAAAALSGVLYVLGGRDGNGQVLSVVECFDPDGGWWQRLPSMPAPRSACACSVLAGRLLVAGGFDGAEGLADVHAWDPASEQWDLLTQMQTWRVGAAAASIGGKLYVVGGKSGNDTLMGERFDPDTGCWQWLPATPARHVYCVGMAAVGMELRQPSHRFSSNAGGTCTCC